MGEKKTFCTIRTLVRRNADLHPDKVALKDFGTGRSCTFGELRDKSNRMGNALYGLGMIVMDFGLRRERLLFWLCTLLGSVLFGAFLVVYFIYVAA